MIDYEFMGPRLCIFLSDEPGTGKTRAALKFKPY